MLKNRRFWIGVVITLIFLFLFIYQVRDDIGEMGRALGEANYLFLLPGILFYYLGVYFRAVRWRFVLKPLGSFSSIRIFPLIVIGMLVNNILPARLGIVARAYILGEKESISKMAVGGTMVVEQISDGVILILFAAIISFFVPLEGLLQQVIYITSGLFIVSLVLSLALVSSPRLAQTTINVVLRVLPKRLRGRTERWLLLLIEGLGIMRSPGQLFIVFILAALVWLCEAGLFYMVGFAFDLGLPFYVY
ncbi:MAG: flippase-like domain-containing protein, partial [Dehalococcoidia bacterium]|nr:flippase-like domain-containing protein [Dehalococcoidia bacterium]